MAITDEAVQLMGGLGLDKDSLVEKLFRDARCGRIEDGVNDYLALVAGEAIINELY